MSDLLTRLDTWGYQLLVAVWGQFWPAVTIICVLAVIERLHPRERGQPLTSWLFNLGCYALLLTISTLMIWAGWGALIARASAWLTIAPLRLAQPEGPWEAGLRWTLALVALDFFNYWLHRLNHAVPALWALHRFHHDERHLSAATSLRAHWLSVPLSHAFCLVPVAWLLGLDALNGSVVLVVTAVVAISHMNCDIGFGLVVVGARYHRVHHDRDRSWHDSNFADVLPLWDILFGTYRAPPGVPGRSPGLADVAPTTSVGAALALPVTEWRRLLRTRINRA